MQAPFALSLNMGTGALAVAALLTGLGFGFVLERSGFGRSDNLTSVFYGRDFRVLRVMFSAVVTAMLGVYFLDLVGFMPISDLGLLPTYVLPQLVGGLLLGIGFVMGGYCPGTSLVAVASGKIDAMLFVGGLVTGTFAGIVSYPSWESFHKSTSYGRVLLHEYFGTSSALMVPLVVGVALALFFVSGRIELWVNARAGTAATPLEKGEQ